MNICRPFPRKQQHPNIIVCILFISCRKYQVQEHTTKPTNHQCQPLYLKWAEIMDSFSQVLSIYNEWVKKAKWNKKTMVLNIKHLVWKKSRAALLEGCSTALTGSSIQPVTSHPREKMEWSIKFYKVFVCFEPHELLQDHIMCKIRVHFLQLIPFSSSYEGILNLWTCNLQLAFKIQNCVFQCQRIIIMQ